MVTPDRAALTVGRTTFFVEVFNALADAQVEQVHHSAEKTLIHLLVEKLESESLRNSIKQGRAHVVVAWVAQLVPVSIALVRFILQAPCPVHDSCVEDGVLSSNLGLF